MKCYTLVIGVLMRILDVGCSKTFAAGDRQRMWAPVVYQDLILNQQPGILLVTCTYSS